MLVVSVLIALMGAAPSFAETGEFHPDRSVSTSPAELTGRALADARSEAVPSAEDPPLTRAATQLRIDEMSPTRWLSRYGHVSIDRRD